MTELYRYRHLLIGWTLREIKVRYKQSLLGAAWAVLQPLSIMLVFSLVFGYLLQVPADGVPYPVFSYAALVPWTFLATSITFAVPSLVNNMNLVTKVYLPRQIFPIASVAASFVDFLIASMVFAGMMLAFGVAFTPALLALPLIVGIEIVLILGVVLLASAVNVFYRDIRFVVPLGMQLWMYLTPIIYPVSQVPPAAEPYFMLNPMAGLVEAYRAVTLHGRWPEWSTLGTAGLVSVAIFVAGYTYFRRTEWQFADII